MISKTFWSTKVMPQQTVTSLVEIWTSNATTIIYAQLLPNEWPSGKAGRA